MKKVSKSDDVAFYSNLALDTTILSPKNDWIELLQTGHFSSWDRMKTYIAIYNWYIFLIILAYSKSQDIGLQGRACRGCLAWF